MGPDLANGESERVGPQNEVFICVWGFFFFPPPERVLIYWFLLPLCTREEMSQS